MGNERKQRIPAAETRVPTSYVRHIAESLVSQGYALGSLLAGTGLRESLFQHPDREISFEQQLQVYENAARMHRDPAFGLGLGSTLRPGDHGVLGYAVYSSADLAQALRIVERFQHLVGPLLSVSMDAAGDHFAVELQSAAPLGAAERLARDEYLALIGVGLLGISEPPTQPIEVSLEYEVEDLATYEAFFDCPVRTVKGEPTALWVRYRDLKRPLNMADPDLAAICEARCDELLKRLGGSEASIEAVRRAIVTEPRQCRSMGLTAERLHMSERTLRRKLSEHGTSFRTIRDEVFADLATKYLVETTLPIDEIADLLGYQDPPNFYRAFRRWTGRSPTDVRQKG